MYKNSQEQNLLFIRRYQAEDNDEVKALHYAGIRQFDADASTNADLFGTDSFIDADLDDIEDVYIQNNGEFLVGIYKEKIIAMGALKKQTNTRGEIRRMRVYPDYQRHGFGKIILEKLMEAALQLGYTELCLDTLAQNIPAQKLYEKYDFIRTGQKKIGRFDVLLYERKINS